MTNLEMEFICHRERHGQHCEKRFLKQKGIKGLSARGAVVGVR